MIAELICKMRGHKEQRSMADDRVFICQRCKKITRVQMPLTVEDAVRRWEAMWKQPFQYPERL